MRPNRIRLLRRHRPATLICIALVTLVALVTPTDGLGGAATAASAETPGTVQATRVAELREVGARLIQAARETADLSLLERAERAFEEVLAAHPDDIEALIGLGSIGLSRHEFSGALTLGQRVEALAPGSPRALGIQVDALIELGRYDEAADSVARMVGTRPDLSSYARLSYLHELHGRLDAAIDAMERAVIAGGPAVENTEYARVLLGDLWLLAGDVERAAFLYRTALENDPTSVPALKGLARVALSKGDLAAALTHLERAVARVPLPDLLLLLAETQEAAGMAEPAAASYRLVAEIGGLQRAAGVGPEAALIVFEADHGDPQAAVALAQAAFEAAPSIRSADALAWALHRAGRSGESLPYLEQALSTGSMKPSFHYHAGVILAALGREAEAVSALSHPGVTDASWSPVHARRAEELLEALS